MIPLSEAIKSLLPKLHKKYAQVSNAANDNDKNKINGNSQ